MFKILIEWYRARFSDPNVAVLMVTLLLIFVILYFFHGILTPILFAVALSYLLERPVNILNRWGLPRTVAVSILLLVFLTLLLAISVVLLPLIWQQGISLLTNLPEMLTKLNRYLAALPERYPELLNAGFFDAVIESIKSRLNVVGNSLLQLSLSSLFGLVSLSVNIVLISLMMFFILKDKTIVLAFCHKLLPKNRRIIDKVATEMDKQISNYLNGKFLEIVLMTIATYLPFWFFGLNYGLLIAVIVGLSVVIPYIGIILATIPVVLISLFQWGFSPDTGYVLLIYAVIQMLDSNIVVPLLFSEKLNLHPLMIVIAVIIFGGLWGFWGIFFAIPLATLVKAIINAWPNKRIPRGIKKVPTRDIETI